jgi:hypothetical protein
MMLRLFAADAIGSTLGRFATHSLATAGRKAAANPLLAELLLFSPRGDYDAVRSDLPWTPSVHGLAQMRSYPPGIIFIGWRDYCSMYSVEH